VVGVCAALEAVSWGAWHEIRSVMLPASYLEAVQRAGATALLLAPDPAVAAEPERVLDLLDALLLAGGSDIDPASYGAPSDPRVTGTSPARDAFELALARAALERDMPVLGICRGMQLLNVATGGGLVAHLPDVVEHDDHRPVPGEWARHPVRLDPDGLAARAAGSEQVEVNSHHHQGVDGVGADLRASGWAADGTVEAIESATRSFVLGVLWHPEQDPGSCEVAALVEAARERRAAGAPA